MPPAEVIEWLGSATVASILGVMWWLERKERQAAQARCDTIQAYHEKRYDALMDRFYSVANETKTIALTVKELLQAAARSQP
jgi:hypothetical protein